MGDPSPDLKVVSEELIKEGMAI